MNNTIETRPLMVSVWCITYNQKNYIRQCLDGIVMQKTNFRFEAIVHDDCSTDGTTDIVREYAEKYPNIIKPLYEDENQYQKGGFQIVNKVMRPYIVGKYVACCEGDDYWTDPLKLQKQVDYLETHPDVVYSCCRFKVLYNSTGEMTDDWNNFYHLPENANVDSFEFDRDYPFTCGGWITLTLTQLHRRDSIDYKWKDQFKYSRDVHSIYDILSNGKGVCQNFYGGVYRINSESTFGGLSNYKRHEIDYHLYREFYEKTGEQFAKDNSLKAYAQMVCMKKTIIPKDIFECKGYLKGIFKMCSNFLNRKK